MVFAIAFCALASMFPNRAVVFLFLALCFSESVLNGLFHAQPHSLVSIAQASSLLLSCIPHCSGTSVRLPIETAC